VLIAQAQISAGLTGFEKLRDDVFAADLRGYQAQPFAGLDREPRLLHRLTAQRLCECLARIGLASGKLPLPCKISAGLRTPQKKDAAFRIGDQRTHGVQRGRCVCHGL